VAGDARAQGGVVGADIGVVGRNVEASNQHIIGAVADGSEREQAEDANHDEFALARFRRCCSRGFSQRRCRLLGRRNCRRLGVPSLAFFRHLASKLIRQLGRRLARGFVPRSLRLGTNGARGLVSRSGH